MKRSTRNTLVGLLLTGAALTLSLDVVNARGVGGPQNVMHAEFSDLDANADGGISFDEVQAFGATRFSNADLDASGALDKAEVVEMISSGIKLRMSNVEEGQHVRPNAPDREAPSAERIAWMADGLVLRFDGDKDGLVTAEEMQPAAHALERLFRRVDTDEDSLISEAEFEAAKARRPGS